MKGTWKNNLEANSPSNGTSLTNLMLMGIISLMGVTMDVNDIFHKATMEMAQNDMHLLQAM
jgi:hypothetical protein